MTRTSLFVRYCRPLVSAIPALYAAGCANPFSSEDCISIGVAAINATVIDASTQRAPSATPVLRIEDGTYAEEYVVPFPRSDPPSYSGAVERPGTYRVIVRATGYQDYVLDDFKVTRSGRCNYLHGVRLTIPLVRTM